MILQSEKEREALIEGGARLAIILKHLSEEVKPGITSAELDMYAQKLIQEGGDTPSFLGYKPQGEKKPFPSALCVSINDVLVHGDATDIPIQKGDVVKLDLGLIHNKLCVDSAMTVPVGDITRQEQDLIETTKRALLAALVVARAGNTVYDIGEVIEQTVLDADTSLIPSPELGGHGLGYKVHEDPFVPNMAIEGMDTKLQEGHIIAIEPIIILGTDPRIKKEGDFAYKTYSGEKGAHFEHTIIVNKDSAPTVVTAL